MNERLERFIVAVLLTAAILITFKNASVRARPDAPREDASSVFVERVKHVAPGSPFALAGAAWIVASLGAFSLVAARFARRLRAGEAIDDPLREPPRWGVADFAVVYMLVLLGQTVVALETQPHLALEDGRTLHVDAAKPLRFGTDVPVPGATGQSAAVVRSGSAFVFEARPVHAGAPLVFLNGRPVPRDAATDHVLVPGDRFDVGGVRGTFRAPGSLEFLLLVGASQLVAPLFVLAAVALRGGSPRDLGLQGFTVREALRGLVGCLAMWPGVIAFTFASVLLCRALSVPVTEHPLLENLAREPDVRAVYLLLLVAGVIAPISEEILFRGFLLRALRRPVPSRAAAIFVTSFFFASIHAGLSSLLPILWVGSIFATLFTSSTRRSLLSSIVCHALFNSMNILLEWGLLRAN